MLTGGPFQRERKWAEAEGQGPTEDHDPGRCSVSAVKKKVKTQTPERFAVLRGFYGGSLLAGKKYQRVCNLLKGKAPFGVLCLIR